MNKKHFFRIIITIIIFQILLSCEYAIKNEVTEEDLQIQKEELVNQHEDMADIQYAKKAKKKQKIDQKILLVPLYGQINDYYCASASTQMIYDYHYGIGSSPSQSSLASIYNTGSIWTLVVDIKPGLEILGFFVNDYLDHDPSKNQIKNQINSGNPILIHWARPSGPGYYDPHYSVIIGYKGKGNNFEFLLNDPLPEPPDGNPSNGGTSSWKNYQTFKNKFLNYWTIELDNQSQTPYPYNITWVDTEPVNIIGVKDLNKLFDDIYSWPNCAIIHYVDHADVAIKIEFLYPETISGFQVAVAGTDGISASYLWKIEAANNRNGPYQTLLNSYETTSEGMVTVPLTSSYTSKVFKITADRNNYDGVVHILELVPML